MEAISPMVMAAVRENVRVQSVNKVQLTATHRSVWRRLSP